MQGSEVRDEVEWSWEWLAGFFDGEGHLGIYRDRPEAYGTQYYSLRLVIGNTDLKVLEAIQAYTGVGRIYSGGKLAKPGYKQMYTWTVSRIAEVTMIVERLSPLCRVKRRELQLIQGYHTRSRDEQAAIRVALMQGRRSN